MSIRFDWELTIARPAWADALQSRFREIEAEVATLFGPSNWRVRRVVATNWVNGPDVFRPDESPTEVDIRVSKTVANFPDGKSALFQSAHEFVHALDFVDIGQASVLEEGVAVWFQADWCVRNGLINAQDMRDKWVTSKCYREAWVAVSPLLASYPDAIKQLRVGAW